jgi:hypothetical protein
MVVATDNWDGVEMVTITLKRYQSLLKSELELMRLDDAGVDNWEGNHYRYGDMDDDWEDDI